MLHFIKAYIGFEKRRGDFSSLATIRVADLTFNTNTFKSV